MRKAAYLALITLIGYVQEAHAEQITVPNPLGNVTFQGVADAIIKNLKWVAAPIFAVMVIWGGIQIMSAGGNPSQWEAGKKTLIWAVVGFSVVILGEEIIVFVKEMLGAPTTP